MLMYPETVLFEAIWHDLKKYLIIFCTKKKLPETSWEFLKEFLKNCCRTKFSASQIANK